MAKARRRANPKLLGIVRRPRPALLVSTALCGTAMLVVSLPALAQPAPNALPTGFAPLSAGVSANSSGNQTTVTQTVQRGAASWQTFNVGSQAQVQFNQPNASAVTLNRVETPNPSQIAGKITANGQIIIENQSGVTFYKGSQVNTAGLMVSAASSSNMAVTNFVNGGNLVTDLAPNPNAAVVNQGHITIKDAGLAALVAPQVVNSGVIVARLGHVVLAGANRVTLDLYGDQMLSIDVTGMVTTLPNGATALVTNSGIIVADGGTVKLTAAAVDGIVKTLVDAGGTIRANTVGNHVGTVVLAGVGGGITVEGQLDAMGTTPGATGGNIVVNTTGNVELASTARVNASGEAGGGVVAIGTTLQRAKGGPGTASKRTAAHVTVEYGAQVLADATVKGNGGRVTVLSTDSTTLNGAISARGGAQGGDGGLVETSGSLLSLGATALVDTRAPHGATGNWLLDPTNFTIKTGGGDETPAQVVTALALSDVTVQADNDITVSNAIDATTNPLATNNLKFQAGRSIVVDASITLNGGAFSGTANDSADAVNAASRNNGAGSFAMKAGATIDTSAGSGAISISVGGLTTIGAQVFTPGTIGFQGLSTGGGNVVATGATKITLGDNVAAGAGTVSLTSSGLISQSSGIITAGTLSGSSVGGATLTKANKVGVLGPFADTGSGSTGFSFTNAQVLATSGAISSATGPVTITTTTGGLTLGGNVTASGTLALVSAGTIGQSSGSITATTLTGSAGGTVTLNDTTNQVGNLGSFGVTGSGDFNFNDGGQTGNLTIAGPVTASTGAGSVSISGAGTMTVTGTVGAVGAVGLAAGSGGIALNGTAVVGNASTAVTLQTPGTVTEAQTAAITTGALQTAGAGVGGNVTLVGTSNAVTELTGFNVTGSGNLALLDSSALQVGPLVSAAGNIYLASSNASGIEVLATGSIHAGGTVGLRTDALKLDSGFQISGSIFELAPFNAGGVSLGGAGTGLSLTGLTSIDVTTVRIGAISIPGTAGPTTIANAITIASGGFGSGSVALELDSTGGIDGSAGALTASTLSGGAGGDVLFTNAGNSIAGLGNFNAGSKNFRFVDTGSLAVTGSVAAATATISAGTIGISGSIVASGLLDLTSTVDNIALTGTALLNGGTVALNATKAITEAGTATIIATSFGATAAAGAIGLLSQANTLATVTGMTATGGGITLIVDPTMVLTGAYTGDNLFFEVAHNGGTLQLGNAGAGATLSATAASNPTISLISDNVTESNKASTLAATDGANFGTIEIAPFTSATPVSLGGTFVAGGSVLVVDGSLLGDIATAGLLRIGNFTGGSITAGNITVDGPVNVGTVALELDSVGAVTQPGSNALTAASLSGSMANGATLLGSANAIPTLGSVAITSGNFTLVDTGSLSVGGNLAGATNAALNAPTIAVGSSIGVSGILDVTSGAGGIALNTGAVLTGGTVVVNGSSGGIVLTGNALLGTTGAVVDLLATGTGVTEASTSTIIATSLLGSVTAASLVGANAVSGVGTFTATSGDFVMTDGGLSGAETVSGPLVATNVNLSGAPTLSVTGSIGATGIATLSAGTISIASGTVTGTLTKLNAGTGGIAMTGTAAIGKSSGTVDLNAAGTISEAATSAITAGTLISSGGTSGTVTLLGTANAIDILGNFALGSPADFSLKDASALTVTGVVAAPGANAEIYLESSNSGGITIASGGSVFAQVASGVVSFQTDSFSIATGGSVNASYFVSLAPNTSGGTVSLGLAVPGELSLVSTAGITTQDLQIGAATQPGGGGTVVANAIVVGGTFDTSGLNAIGLYAHNTITQSAPLIGNAGLYGQGGSYVLLNGSNALSSVNIPTSSVLQFADSSAFTVIAAQSSGNVYLATSNAGGITLNGTASANGTTGTIGLKTDAFVVTSGTMTAPTVELAPFTSGSLVTVGGSGGLSLANVGFVSGNLLRIGAVTVPGSGLTTTAGSIAVGGAFGSSGLALELDSQGGITQTAGVLTASALTGNAGAAGVALSDANAIAALGSFIVSGGTFVLTDAGTTNLTVNGTVSATGETITGAGTATIASTITATAGTLLVSGGSLVIATGGLLSDPGGAVDLSSTVAGITETGTGSINAGTLQSANGAAGNVNLGNGNSITTLDGFVVTGGSLFLADGSNALTVGGSVNASGGVTLAAGTISVGNSIVTAADLKLTGTTGIGIPNGGLLNGGTVDLSSSTGNVSEGASGTIIAGTLVSTSGVHNGATLTGSNTIAALGGFVSTNSVFALNDAGTGTLAVIGVVSAPTVTITNVPTAEIGSTITATTGTLQISGGGSIALNSGGLLSAGVVDVSTTGGGITENGGAIDATTLLSSGGVTGTGTVSLGGANSVGTLTGFVSGGSLFLADGSNALTVGSVNAAGVTLTAGTIGVVGTIFSGNDVVLAGATGIGINSGALIDATGALDLSASGGGVVESTGGTIIAGTLVSGSGVQNTVTLLSANNQINGLGAFAVSNGDLLLLDKNSVLVSGAVSGQDIFAKIITTGNGITLGTGGSMTATNGSNPQLTLVADQLIANGGAGTIGAIGGTIAIAPFTSATAISIDGSGIFSGLQLASNAVAAIKAGSGTLQIGSYNDSANGNAFTTTAGNISIDGAANLSSGAATLRLNTPGSITDSGANGVQVGTLVGTAAAAVSMTGSNTIAVLGSFTAAGFTLNDALTLTVAGPVNGGNLVAISDSQPLVVNGSVISAGTVSLGGSSLTIGGSAFVTDGGSGTTSLFASSGTINEVGTLIAGSLNGKASGAATLTGATATTNQVATLGSFTAGGFTLDDGIALTVAGPVNGGASATILDPAAVTINGSLLSSAAINVTGSTITINGGGLVSDGGGAGTTSLVATSGTINEVGTLVSGTLSGRSTGATTLTGATTSTNQVANLGSFSAAGFSLNDGLALTVAGPVNGGASVGILDANALTVNGSIISSSAVNLAGASLAIGATGFVTDGGAGNTSLIASGGTINEVGTLIAGTLTGLSTGATTLTGATSSTNQVANLGSFTAGGFTLDDGLALAVAGPVNGNASATILDTQALTVNGSVVGTALSLTGTALTINGSGFVSDGGAGTTSLVASAGTINEVGTLVVGTLSGRSTGATTLTGATTTTNQVANIGSFSAAGFVLDNGAALGVGGPLNGGTSVTILDSQVLTVTGSLFSSNAISLTASQIAINGGGFVSDGGAGTTSLIATGGTINEVGTLIAGTLSGHATGATTLTGATTTTNQVANLGSFTAAGFVLDNGAALGVGGPVNGGTSVTILDSQGLTVTGSLIATNAVSLTASQIAINGSAFVSDGGAGTTSLVASAGTINDIGTLIAGTLSGLSTGATNLAGATNTTNQIATLGSFTAAGFTLNDGLALAIAGPVNGNASATIFDSQALTVNGRVGAAAISLTGSSIAISGSGLVTDGGAGTTSLVATSGTINEVGTLVVGTLTGSSTAAATLAGVTSSTNQVATLGSFSAAGFLLNDGLALAVAGPVNGGTSATILDTQALTVTGSVVATNAISLTGSALGISGFVTDGGAGTTSLIATAGTINETGTVIAGTLSGGSTGATTLIGATATTNQIATLGSFTAAGFTLDDGEALAVSGPVNGGTSASIVDALALTVNGSLFASNAISLSATGITINGGGFVSDGGAGTTSLLASNGTINEVGTLIAGTLTGNSTGATTLSGATATTNQVANLGSFTAASFRLNDGEALVVAGPVSGAGGITVADPLALTVNGSMTGNPMSLTAASITVNGGGFVSDGGAGTTSLVATGGTINEIGTLVAGTLSGSATGAASLTGTTAATNQIANLASFTATNLTLNDGSALTVIAPVTATTGTVAITTQAALSNNSTIQAQTNATLVAATDVTNGGSVIAQTGSASVTASAGTITTSGRIQAGTNATLSAGTDITNGNTGSIVAAGGAASLTATAGTLTNNGLVQASTSDTLLAGTNVTNTGSVIAQNGTVSVTATAGTIATSGRIQAGTNATLLAGTDITNSITGSIVAGGGNASLTATAGTLGNNGLVQASGSDTLLAGSNVTNTGSVIAQTGTVGATATNGTLFNSGVINASTGATLGAATDLGNTGSVVVQNGNAALTATAGTLSNSNLIRASGNATLTGANVGNTASGSVLAQGGTVSATATNGTLTNGGLIQASSSETFLASSNLTNSGSMIAQGGSISATATGGTLSNSGLMQANSNDVLSAGSSLTNSGSVLAQNGSISATASAGTLSNSGLMQAHSNDVLTASSNLGNSGSVIAQSGSIAATASGGTLSNSGLMQASTGNTLLASNSVNNTASGSVISQTGSVSVTATSGTITTSGLIRGATNAALTAGTDITNTNSGSIIATSGNASLTATAGTLTNNDLIQAGASVILVSGTPLTTAGLTNTGVVTAQGGSASLTASTGTLFNSGVVTASSSDTLLAGNSVTNTGSVITQSGNASVTATSGSISTSGLVRAAANATLSAGTGVANSGSVIALGGSLAATASGGPLSNSGLMQASSNETLLASSGVSNTGRVIAQGGSISATGSSGTLYNNGAIQAPASVTLSGNTGITNDSSGAISAGTTLTLSAANGPIVENPGGSMTGGTEIVLSAPSAQGNMTLSGLVNDVAGTVNVNAGGTIFENGTLIAGILTGIAANTANFGTTTALNQIGTLGNFTVGSGSLAVNDSTSLHINGTISAATMELRTPGTIFLDSGQIITAGMAGGASAPVVAVGTNELPGVGLNPAQWLATQGAYLTAGSVVETAAQFTVSNLSGVITSLLNITLSPSGAGGIVHFSDGLQAPTTWLIVNVGAGQGDGTFNVKRFDFVWQQPAQSANFSGSTIDGKSGQAAAGAAFIQPQQNANFRIDGCPIHSVNCVLLTTQGVPQAPPITAINIGAPATPGSPEDLVLPVVSDERFELLPCYDPNGGPGCPAPEKKKQ